MKTLLRAFVFACVFAVGLAHADPQGVSFTYQGQLRNSGTVVNGNHNLTFALYDAQTSGLQIGSTVTANNWPIIDGLFTIDLTFPGAFAGNQRWLEVTVDGTPLAPRQPVSATPVAQYALTGNPGPQGNAGLNSLSLTAVEPAGANCATGGTRLDFGLDANNNGLLDAGEVNAALRRYVCNGAQGPQGIQGATGATGSTGASGSNGLNTLTATAAEPAGANCATAGVRVDFGVDANSNGALDAGEVNAALRRYVCNGAQGPQGIQGIQGSTGATGNTGASGSNGLNSLTATAAEPAGANCATGGARVDFGLDANGNGVLDTGEVNAALRRYVCNGAQGPQGVQGATGATGATGAAGPQGAAGSLGLYGDGSAGALNITTNTDWNASFPGANLQFTSINVSAGVTLTVPSGTVLRATGNVTINGTINVLQAAADNGSFSPVAGVALSAAANPAAGVGLTRLSAARLATLPVLGGGAGARNGGNTGGEGGGSFAIYALGSINIAGTGAINANGANAVNLQTAATGIPGGGGGAGGVIVLLGKASINVAGAVRSNAGNGANGFDGNGGNAEGGGGGGGGGIIHLLSSTSPSVTGTTATAGGVAGANAGASATINNGGGGGACGGNGGSAGSTTTTASAGSTGYVITTVVATPENLAL